MNWIDAHTHAWTPDSPEHPRGATYPVPGRLDASKLKIEPDDYAPEIVLGNARPSGVSRVVLIQMSFYRADNSYMTDAIAAYPEAFRGVAWVDHKSGRVAEEMTELLKQGVTGFRIVPEAGIEDRWLQNDGFEAMWEAAAETKQAMCPLLDPIALADVGRMCARFPDTNVVIDHLARIGADGSVRQAEVDALCDLARHAMVNVKLSAFYALGEKSPPYLDLVPMIRRVYDAFGPDRLMWASDCPFQIQNHTYEDSIGLVRDRLDFLSDADREKIFRTTAERVFFYR